MSPLQSENAWAPMVVTVFGRVRDLSLSQLRNDWKPTLVNVSGSVTEVSVREQLLKAAVPIIWMPGGTITLVTDPGALMTVLFSIFNLEQVDCAVSIVCCP